MTEGVVTAHLDAPVKEIAKAMTRNRISAVPVVDARHAVVGVVTASDLLEHFAAGPHRGPAHRHLSLPRRGAPAPQVATAQAVMSTQPVTVRPDTTIADAARVATDRRLHFLPVVAGGVLVGCVTKADLAKVYVRPDGEIRDEIENRVMREQMLLRPGALGVDVTEGIVAIAGRLAGRAEATRLLDRVDAVPGVIDVRSRFTYVEDLEET
jgi:CBS domain-containing protein